MFKKLKNKKVLLKMLLMHLLKWFLMPYNVILYKKISLLILYLEHRLARLVIYRV